MIYPLDKSSPIDPFFGIMIEDSFVLNWQFDMAKVTIQCEFSLWPGNPHYETPKEDEWTCYKIGVIVIRTPSSLESIVPMDEAELVIGIKGEKDYGSIESAEITNNFLTLTGPFGAIEASVDDLKLIIN